MAAQAADASLATEIEFEMSPQGVYGGSAEASPISPLAASKRPILLLPCSVIPPRMRRACFGFTDHPVYNSCKTGYSGACHPCYSSMAQSRRTGLQPGNRFY